MIPTGRAKRARKVMAALRSYPAASLLLWASSILLHSDTAAGADSACKGLLALIFIFCMKSSPPSALPYSHSRCVPALLTQSCLL